MEVGLIGGGSYRLDLSWWMVATGILMFLPPPMCLAAYCDDRGVIPCPMNKLDGVNCTYARGKYVHTNGTGYFDYPSPAHDLRVEPTLQKLNDTHCGVYFNISWMLPRYGAKQCKGFLLNASFVRNGLAHNIYRLYNFTVADWDNAIKETAFRHECIAPFKNTSYRIKVHSLPLSESNYVMVERPYINLNTLQNSLCVSGSVDPLSSFDWAPVIWENILEEEDGSVSVEVCIFMAPKELGFKGYRVALLNSTDGRAVFDRTSRRLDNDSIIDNGDKSRRKCRKFERVCTGTYKAKVLPVPSDECYARGHKQPCQPTESQHFVVNSSVCSPHPKPHLPSASTSQPHQPLITAQARSSDDRENDGKVTVVVCGVMAAIAFIVITVVATFVCRKRYGQRTGRLDCPKDSIFDPPPPLERQPVLLIYSTDNESHRKVVRCFAAYLNAWCGCDVIYDEWSQVEIAQTSPIEWLSKQMYSVKHVVIVNSLGAHLQHTGWIERRSYQPRAHLLLPDVFVPAIRQVQNKMFSKNTPQFRSFHVCFPHTEPKHVLELSCGRCYRLMDHIEDLFLNVHGLSKFSAKGTMSANHINSTDYVNSKEGRALRTAVEEAINFARENPDWFHTYYRIDESGPTHRDAVIYDRCQPPNRPEAESGSLENRQLQDESGNGSIGTASDMEYYPPSLDGGGGDGCSACRVDLGGGLQGASLTDDGIGGMSGPMSDAAASLPLFAQFSPVCPDDLEDDDVSSIGSRSFIAKVRELNDQYDSGYYPSIKT